MSDFTTKLNVATSKISFAILRRDKAALSEIRQAFAAEIAGVDPEKINTSSADYRAGAFEALAAIALNCEDHSTEDEVFDAYANGLPEDYKPDYSTKRTRVIKLQKEFD